MTKEISGKSLMWMLIGLGSNAVTYPSFFGTKAQSNSLLRASPLLCLADTILIIASAIYAQFYRLNLTDTIDLVSSSCGLAIESQGPGPWIARICTFIFATLPQLLKLLGARGIPWTATYGTIFVVSSMFSGIVSFLASKTAQNNTTQQPPTKNASARLHSAKSAIEAWFTSLRTPAIVLILVYHSLELAWVSYHLNSYLTLMTIPDHLSSLEVSRNVNDSSSLMTTLIVGCTLVLTGETFIRLSMHDLFPDAWKNSGYWLFIMCSWFCAGLCITVHLFFTSFLEFMPVVGVATIICAIFVLLRILTKSLMSCFLRSHSKDVQFDFSLDVLLSRLATVLIYYCVLYQADGTWQEPWTRIFN